MNDLYNQWENDFTKYINQELYEQAVDVLTTNYAIAFSSFL